MRRRAKADDNQAMIVAVFRKMGASVCHVHSIPHALDLIIGFKNQDVRIEIKDGSKPPSARRLTEGEAKTIKEWRGRPPVVIECEDDVIKLLESM